MSSRAIKPITPRARNRRPASRTPVRLRGQERRLIEALVIREQDTVDLQADAAWLATITGQPRKLLWRLADKQVAHRLQNGRYLVDRRAIPRSGPAVGSLDGLAGFLLERLDTRPYYLSWHSALWRYALVDQQSRQVQVALQGVKRNAYFGSFSVQFIKVTERKFFDGRNYTEREAGAVPVASPEKALIDSLDRPALAGGMAVAVTALRRAHARGLIDPERLVATAIRFDSPTLCRRLGFFMERYGIPGAEPLLRYLGKGYAVALQPGGGVDDDAGPVDTRWGVRLDRTLLRATDTPK